MLVSKREDRPRLILLVDVSLSVRNTAKFTIHLVHSLQSLFSQVRTFAFVSDLVEVTPYLERCELDEALGMIFGGEILDVDANSDYGHALATFNREHLSAVNRRTTVLVLGDGRGNGHPPHVWALEDVRRRARQLVWLTPEQPRYWHLGRSNLPDYAEVCDRVEIVRDLDQLEGRRGRRPADRARWSTQGRSALGTAPARASWSPGSPSIAGRFARHRARVAPTFLRTGSFAVHRTAVRHANVVHNLPVRRDIDNESAALIADELVGPALVSGPGAFERCFAGIVESTGPAPQAWLATVLRQHAAGAASR